MIIKSVYLVLYRVLRRCLTMYEYMTIAPIH